MTKTATELIHIESIGNIASCREVSEAIYPGIKKLYDAAEIKGYTIAVVNNSDDVDSYMLPNNFLEITKGTYPFLYVVVQPQDEDTAFEGKISFLDHGYAIVIND